jgi:hypothetical protein
MFLAAAKTFAERLRSLLSTRVVFACHIYDSRHFVFPLFFILFMHCRRDV